MYPPTTLRQTPSPARAETRLSAREGDSSDQRRDLLDTGSALPQTRRCWSKCRALAGGLIQPGWRGCGLTAPFPLESTGGGGDTDRFYRVNAAMLQVRRHRRFNIVPRRAFLLYRVRLSALANLVPSGRRSVVNAVDPSGETEPFLSPFFLRSRESRGPGGEDVVLMLRVPETSNVLLAVEMPRKSFHCGFLERVGRVPRGGG